ncbi:MAG: purine-nucleoside phosphorylase [Actinomycetota bacterium]
MSNGIVKATGRSDWKVAVVLGSGSSGLAREIVGGDPISFADVEGLHASTVAGHEGALYAGDVSGVPTLMFAGRVHLYEGHGPRAVTSAVETAIGAGCDTIVLNNAAGGINLDLDVGAPALISDHLNLTGQNPLMGEHDEREPRFPDLTNLYDAELRNLARSIDPDLKEGVYAGLTGPTYETPAEVTMLKALGADLVGMSTVLEAIMARYLGAKVLGISVVTNYAAGTTPEPLSHEEVTAASRQAAARLMSLLRGVLERLY